MVFGHEAEIEDMGTVFQVAVYVITAERWRSEPRLAGAAHADAADRGTEAGLY